MTLCKYRPQRTYDEQYIIDGWDMRGLLKYLGTRSVELAADGRAEALSFQGAFDALSIIAGLAEDGKCDNWTDFQRQFELRAGTLMEEGD